MQAQQEIVSEEMELDDAQQVAIDRCCDLQQRIVAVTGVAGTGKTTILRNVYRNLYRQGCPVVLCAPTGKAAKRITEATGIEAVTIHRLLEYPMPGEIDEKTGKALVSSDPKRGKTLPIIEKVVLCDEYAMTATEVHRNLLAALPSGGVIRVFGDINQLQPIETSKRLQALPSSFEDLLNRFEGITLDTIHRQAGDSTIITNGMRIVKGQMPVKAEDFAIKISAKPVNDIIDFIMDKKDAGVDFGSITSQMITPTKKGWIGTQAMNSAIQNILHNHTEQFHLAERQKWSEVEEQRFYIGDKVIFTVNNYALGVFNGETGLVVGFQDDGTMAVDFGDKTIEIPPSLEVEGKRGSFFMNPQKDVDLAYVITTHKAQGSEYEEVCYIMNSSRPFLLNRKNLYTAVSRARSKVTVICDQKALSLSLTKKGDK